MNLFKRWYDADAAVSRAINELEQLSLEDQYNYIMRRWYDKNVKVSHAIEYLRLSPKEVRRETALKVLDYLKEIQKEEV